MRGLCPVSPWVQFEVREINQARVVLLAVHIDTVQVGMYGVIGQMQREEGARKTKRGMTGVIRSGRSAGGRAYGYKPIPGAPGELEINEAEAGIVRRVFRQYAGGVSPRSIAADLNSEGIAPPRGSKWNASTINGNGQRMNGILRNPLYAGRLIWNRVRMVKDPSTGRRISRVNKPEDFEEIAAPHLRIVEEELFQAVQKRKEERGGEHARSQPKTRRLLSGLLKCGSCGGGLSIIGADRSGPRVVCSTHKESGTCSNSARYYIEKLERQVLDRLKVIFADTSVIDAYVKEYQEERRRVELERRKGRAALEKSLADSIDAITAIVVKLSKGLIEDDEAAAILPGMRAERERYKRELADVPPVANVLDIKPKAVEMFRRDIEKLADILTKKGSEPTADLAISFRKIVSAVVMEPRLPGQNYRYEINGLLSAIAGPELVGCSNGSGGRN